MAYKRCPKCELNYINEDQGLCECCQGQSPTVQSTKSGRKTYKPFPQKCTIVNQEYFVEKSGSNQGAWGYKIFSSKDTLIGVVLADPKYKGRAVIRFCNDLKDEYGVWHLIQSKYPFDCIQKELMKRDIFSLEVD